MGRAHNELHFGWYSERLREKGNPWQPVAFQRLQFGPPTGRGKCQGNSAGARMQNHRGGLWCPDDGCLTARGKPENVSES